LIGQETIANTLQNAIRSDRVAHAFLFAGSRGVGKTSAARIVTKALNCLEPDAIDPCNACENCREISSNASADVFEIDAASNRGIENIRELRENVKYAPARCRYKVYIIDEAHMLTLESFNALLKTLEEPPPHVKFILATTDPHKVPVTILSRCQRYDFQRVPLGRMVDFLSTVAVQEQLQLSPKALALIARHAVGGMRDALTALDQILSYAGSSATDEEVREILGIADASLRFELLEAILRKQTAATMIAFRAFQSHGMDLQELLQELLQSVKTLSLSLTLQGDLAGEDITEEEVQRYRELSGLTTLGELQQMFQILLQLEEQMKRSVHAQICFEMALLQLAAVQPLIGVSDLLQQVRALRKSTDGASNAAPAVEVQEPSPSSQTFASPQTATPQSGSPNSKPSFYAAASPSAPEPRPEQPNKGAQDALRLLRGKDDNAPSPQKKTLNPSQTSNVPPPLAAPPLEKDPDSKLAMAASEEVAPQKLEPPPGEWLRFVRFVQERASLTGTLLRSAVPTDLTASEFVLEFRKSPQLFTEEHQAKLKHALEEFGQRPVTVRRSDQTVTHGTTLQEYEAWQQAEEKRRREEQARKDPQVQQILEVFVGSEIREIQLR
jgi:DNA polymerase-3 subunit gamma/tau